MALNRRQACSAYPQSQASLLCLSGIRLGLGILSSTSKEHAYLAQRGVTTLISWYRGLVLEELEVLPVA